MNDAVSDVAANTLIEPLIGTIVVVGAAVVGVTVAGAVVVEAVVVEAFVVVVTFALVVVGLVVVGFAFEVLVVASVGDAPNSASNPIMTGTIR